MNTAWRIIGIVAAFVVVFIFGGVIGGSAVVLFNRNHFQEVRAQREKELSQRQLQRKKESEAAAAQITALRQQIEQLQQSTRGGGLLVGQQRRGSLAPEQFGPHLMQMFANRLELTADQQQQVHALVFQTAEELRRLSRDTAHNSQVAIEHLEDQISALLTPPQRDHFNAMITRGREAFQRWSEQQQQRRAQQRREQQSWRQGAQGQGKAPSPSSPAAPASPAPSGAPATPAAPAATPPAAPAARP